MPVVVAVVVVCPYQSQHDCTIGYAPEVRLAMCVCSTSVVLMHSFQSLNCAIVSE